MRMLNLVPAVLSLDSMKFHGKSWLSKQRILMLHGPDMAT